MQKRCVLAVLLWFTLASVSAQSPGNGEHGAMAFDIAAQPLARALQTLAEQANLQILFVVSDVSAFVAPPVTGRMSPEEALARLLDGTSLESVRQDDVIVVRERAVTRSAVQGGSGPGSLLTLTLAEAAPLPAVEAPPAVAEPEAPQDDEAIYLGETLVTGTLIRGAQTASPLVILGRADIDRSGYSTVQELIQSLPQNYAGGDTELAIASPGGSSLNIAGGAAANLRGLGAHSTLVLVNGQRLAPAAFGQFVDLSMIPLTAIERVEVLTDGASATYGSDAVGGVINFILDEDYDGAETLLKAGAVTDGDLEEYQASQTLGFNAERSHGLLTYEYYERSPLDANDRDYSAPAADPYDLLQEQQRHSLFGSAGFDLGARAELTATALFSERQAERVSANIFTLEPTREPTETRQLSASVSAALDLAETWRAELTALYGRNDTHRDLITPTTSRTAERNQLDLTSAELKADGVLFALPAGEVRLAVGGGWREENFESHTPGGYQDDRSVYSAFAEVSVPVLEALELSLAGRYEDYSDFGSTTNPKLGLAWSPTRAFTLRGTYGTSFRAPILSELDDSNASGVLIELADPTVADGTTLIMLASGNQRDLQPEEAITWTAGIDFTAGEARQFSVHLTYFDTEYEDRITELLPNLEILGVFNQADVYAPIIDRTPDLAEVVRLASLPFFFNLYGPFVPEDVEAIVDRRRQNISASEVRGVDLAARYALERSVGRWLFQLDATYFTEFANRITSAAPPDEVLDTAYHPIDLRARASVGWMRQAWSATAFVNYADGYENDTVTPSADVDSWTTVDLQLAYDLEGAGWLDGLRLALSAQNVFDEDPPFVSSPLAGIAIGFDPTNASPVGRFLSLTATLRW